MQCGAWSNGRCAVILVVLAMLGTVVAATELRGRVEHVRELEVWIRMDSALAPNPGDPLELRFRTPDGDELSIGRWRVGAVQDSLVWATVVEHTGRPAVGHIAVVESLAPRATASARQSPPPAVTPAATPAPPPPAAGGDRELQAQLEALRSPSAVAARGAARTLYQQHRDDSEVQAAANDTLIAGFDQRPRDDHHVDAMAYLCNILGESGDRRYLSTLRAVAKTSPNAKLRKYAAANLGKLQ